MQRMIYEKVAAIVGGGVIGAVGLLGFAKWLGCESLRSRSGSEKKS